MKCLFNELAVNEDGSINLSCKYIPSFVLEKCPIWGITRGGRFGHFSESVRKKINSDLKKGFKGFDEIKHFNMTDYRILLDFRVVKCDDEPIIFDLEKQAPLLERLISNAVRDTIENYS